MSRSSVGTLAVGVLALAAAAAPAWSQKIEENLTATEAAVAVRNAPYSQTFRVGSTYLVKDRDYNPAEPKIQFSSLWVDEPSRRALEVAVRYCVPDDDIAFENAALTELVLLDGNRPLTRLTKLVAAQPAQQKLVRPPRYYPPVVVGPYGYGPYGFWGGYVASPGSYFPAVDCSAGASRFDLSGVRASLARLPNRTLKVKLLFDNGAVQNWQLGSGTVQALKRLPSIGRIVAGG